MQAQAIGIARIAEIDVFKVDRAVRNLGNRLRGVVQRALLIQHLGDALARGLGHDQHDEDHRDHHQVHQDLHNVAQHRGQLARGQAARHNHARAEPREEQHAGVHAELHQRAVQRNEPLGLEEEGVNEVGDLVELPVLIVLAHVALDDAHAAHVLLHHGVQIIIGLEHPVEHRERPGQDEIQADDQERNDKQEHGRQPGVDVKRHAEAKDQQDGRAHGHADDHLIGVLHAGDVGRHAGDEGRGRELVDVREREVLHPVVHVAAQVVRETGRRARGADRGERAADHRKNGDGEQQQAVLPDLVHIAPVDAIVDQPRHQQRDDDLSDAFTHDEKGREQRIPLVFTDAAEQGFQHRLRFPPSGFLLAAGSGASGRASTAALRSRRA